MENKKPSQEEQDTRDKILTWYSKGIAILNEEKKVFGDKTLIEYKNEMTRRLNGDINHLNLDIENPVSFPIVRKVLKSYVSKVASNPVEMVIKSFNITIFFVILFYPFPKKIE